VSEAGLGQQAGLPGFMQWWFLLLTGSVYPALSIPAASQLAALAADLQAGLHQIAGRVHRQGAAVAAAAAGSAAAAPMAAAAAQAADWIDQLAGGIGQLGSWLDDLAYETAALRVQAITYLAGLAATPATDMAMAAAGPAQWLEFLITEIEVVRVVLGTSYGRVLAVVARGTVAQLISQELLGIEAQGTDLALHITQTWSWAMVVTDAAVAAWGEALAPISAGAERFSRLIDDSAAGKLIGKGLISPGGAGGHNYAHEITFYTMQGGSFTSNPGNVSYGASEDFIGRGSHAAREALGITPGLAPQRVTTPAPQPQATPTGQAAASHTPVNPITGVPIPARPITAPEPEPEPATPRPWQALPQVPTPQPLTITPPAPESLTVTLPAAGPLTLPAPAPERRTLPSPGAGHFPGPGQPAVTQSPPTTPALTPPPAPALHPETAPEPVPTARLAPAPATVPTPPQSPDPIPAPARPLTPHTATTPSTTPLSTPPTSTDTSPLSTPPISRQPTPVPHTGNLAQSPARGHILAGPPADGRIPAGPLHLSAAPLAARQPEPGGIPPGWPGDAVPPDSQASGQALITWAQDQAKAGDLARGQARLALGRLGLYNLPPLPAAARATLARPAAGLSGDQPRTRSVLLPGISGVTAPEWASTNSAGISTRLSPAPVRRTGQMRPAGAAPPRPVRYRVHVSGDQRHAGLGRLHRAGVPPRARNEHQQHGLAGPALGLEHPGALMRGATGWRVRRPGAVPTWAELETLAYQTVARTAADGPGGRLGAAPGREVGRCVALALAWRDTLFPGGIAASTAADDLVAGRSGLLAGLVAAGGWMRAEAPGQVEAALASTPGALYAMVVWEPAGQVAGHATVWHAHRAGPAVRWMDLEAGPGQWMGPGGPPGFATGHARAVYVSAEARVLNPPAIARGGSADLSALLEFAPARPVTGKKHKSKDKDKSKDKGKDKGKGQDGNEEEASSSNAPRTLEDIAQDFRDSHNHSRHIIGRSRNVSVLQYDIDGHQGEFVAVSGTTAVPGAVGPPETPIFDTMRPADSEWMELEALAAVLNSESAGWAALYSERSICSSCARVIEQFRAMFPGVDLDVSAR
jgi:hypothetical protein